MSDKIEAPQFNLSQGNLGFKDDAEFQKSMEGGKGFQPGNYDLKIVAAAFHKNKTTGSIYCAKDPTWFNVQVTFAGPDDRSCKYWVQVPTSSLKFGEKKTTFPAKKFTEFMAAIGLPCALADLGAVVPKWLTDPSKLIGKGCNVDVDYEGAHAKKEGSEYVIVRGDGKVLEDESGKPAGPFPDFDAAKNYAEGQGIDLRYPEIVKFNPAPAAKKADDDKW